MVSATWFPPFPFPPVGSYHNTANWVPGIVPDETAFFGAAPTSIVTIGSPVSIGGWTITGNYQFISSSTINFTGAGIIGAAALTNTGTVNFLNSSTAGNLAIISSGTVNFSGNSTAGNATIVVGVDNALNFTGGATGGNAAIVTDSGSGHFGRVNFLGDGPAHNHKLTAGSIAGGGIFDLGSNTVTVGGNGTSTTVSGQILGTKNGALVKDGYGTLTLNGVNSYGGGTVVKQGYLVVNGAIGKVSVGEGFNFAVLHGNGVVGATNVRYGILSPGNDTPGRMTTGTLKFTDNSYLKVEITNGTFAGPNGYDQVNVVGKVKLGRAHLQAESLYDYNPAARHNLTIIVNNKKDAVDGAFSGGLHGTLREGDAFVVTEQVYSITYRGGTGNDVVLRSQGPSVQGTAAGDVINLSVSPTHTATKRADYIEGMGGNDTIATGRGNDTVLGGDGIDFMDGGAGQDFVSFKGENGDIVAKLKGGKLTTVTIDGVASDQFRNFEHLGGGNGNDRLTGNGKDNVLRGDDGNDTLKGGAGNDMLFGEENLDVLTGGKGKDKFVFTDYGSQDFDRITDFRRGEDKLVLDGYQFYELGAKLNKSEFFAKKGATQAHDADDHLIYDTKTGTLYYDRDGLGGQSADIVAIIAGRPKLSVADFELI